MFEHFCTAVMLECVFMKHGRQFTIDAVMQDYIIACINEDLFMAIKPEKGRLN